MIKCAKVIGGKPVHHAHANPFFDMKEYEVEFTDGTIEQYAANMIADEMYAQVDNEGNMFQLLDEIMDHKKDNTAIDIANGTVTWASGNVKPKIIAGEISPTEMSVSIQVESGSESGIGTSSVWDSDS